MKTNELLEKILTVLFQGHLNKCTANLSTSTISKQCNVVFVDMKLFTAIEEVLEISVRNERCNFEAIVTIVGSGWVFELRSQAIVGICDDTIRFKSVSAQYALCFIAIGHRPATPVAKERERIFRLVIHRLFL